MRKGDIVRFREEVRDELERDILPWWLALKDPHGGYYGEVDACGHVRKDAPRGVVLDARLVWTFSAAYEALRCPELLEAAAWAKDWFVENFIDTRCGGVYWSVAADGSPLEDKKQLYAQGFAIYGLSEWCRVHPDKEALEAAVGLFRVVEDHFADPEYGGYVEALSRDFSPLPDMSLSAHDINADKTMNSHLHLLEAYANLYRVWPDPALKAASVRLLRLVCDTIMAPSGHLGLYFRRDWTALPGGISFGHDIETSWLVRECAGFLGGPSLGETVRPAALRMGAAGNEGLLPDGSMRYERLPDGTEDLSRQWWVQAETVVGNLHLWQAFGDPAGLDRAEGAWTFIRDRLVDRAGGEWYWGLFPDGTPDTTNPKAGFWKCPYHNARMCLQVMEILKDQ